MGKASLAGFRNGQQTAFSLERDEFGRLVLLLPNEAQRYVGVEAVRAFPITHPQDGVALCGADGGELLWIDELGALPEAARRHIEEALAQREFMPELVRIVDVSSYTTPCVWEVETSRGETSFVLRDVDDMRRLRPHGLLIIDSNGLRYLVRDLRNLDKGSRRILDRLA